MMTYSEFLFRFPNEKTAIDFYFAARYDNVLACNHCGATVKVYKDRKRAKVCHCRNCNNSFSPFTDTIFEKSSTDMRKWFYAIHLVLNGEKRISACRLQRELGVLYKTARRILHLIREVMGNEDTAKSFKCFAEIDVCVKDKVFVHTALPEKIGYIKNQSSSLYTMPQVFNSRTTNLSVSTGL
jgi:transposase-like protein